MPKASDFSGESSSSSSLTRNEEDLVSVDSNCITVPVRACRCSTSHASDSDGDDGNPGKVRWRARISMFITETHQFQYIQISLLLILECVKCANICPCSLFLIFCLPVHNRDAYPSLLSMVYLGVKAETMR